jgi:peptidoglycan/LPS O-acetylase OafA/YrhL
MRRYPAFLWVPVYIGSLLVLNGGHPDWRPGELAAGIGLVVLAAAVSTYLALRPWPGRPSPAGVSWLVFGVLGFYMVCAIVAGAFAGPGAGLATLLAGLVPLTAVSIWVAHMRAKTPAIDDNRDPVPGVALDDERPMGDTPEAHDEIVPQDLPKDHPGRQAAERFGSANRVRR